MDDEMAALLEAWRRDLPLGAPSYRALIRHFEAQLHAAKTARETAERSLLDENFKPWRDRAMDAEALLRDLGYQHCDIAACGCGLYHRLAPPAAPKPEPEGAR